MTRIARKALIYATSPRGLLVFDEPDFPSVPTQVPGGTIDAGETPMEAAYREFEEETGLVADQWIFWVRRFLLLPDMVRCTDRSSTQI